MINLRVTNIIFKYISAVTCFALVCLLHAAISYRRMAVWHISVVSVTAVADTDTVLQVAVRRAIITRIRVRIRIGIFPSATAASIRITAEMYAAATAPAARAAVPIRYGESGL